MGTVSSCGRLGGDDNLTARATRGRLTLLTPRRSRVLYSTVYPPLSLEGGRTMEGHVVGGRA